MEDEQIEQAKGVIDELREAAKPIDLEALAERSGSRLRPVDADVADADFAAPGDRACDAGSGCVHGRRSEEPVRPGGEVHATASWRWSRARKGMRTSSGIALPPQSPMQPAVAQLGDLFVFCTSKDLLEKSLKMLAGGEGDLQVR